MQRTYMILTALFAATVVAACGMSAEPRAGRIGKLTDKDQKSLELINQNMADHIAARENAGFGFVAAPVTGKVQKMSESIKKNCTNSGSIPASDTVGATNTQVINGADCPVYWYRARGITSNGVVKTLRLIDKLEINVTDKNADFVELSGLKFRREDGAIESRPEGRQVRVKGTVKFNGYNLAEVGEVVINIATDQTYEGDIGQGWISINVFAGNVQHVGWITWKFSRNAIQPATYTVDNTQVEEKDFNRLFSSFELSKIVDSSVRMK